MSLPFTQYDFEAEQKDCLKHGDIKRIAAFHGTSPTLHEQQFDQNNERSSNGWRFLNDLIGLAGESRQRADNLLDLVTRFFHMAANADDSRPKVKTSVEEKTSEICSSFNEFVQVSLADKNLYQRLESLDKLSKEVHETREAILEQINAEKSSFNAPNTRYSDKTIG